MLNYAQFSRIFKSCKHGVQFVTKITFVPQFNSNVDDLPSSLLHLIFSGDFTHSLDHLPNKLQSLCVYQYSGDAIDHLPPSLTHLTIGTGSRFGLDHLPASLIHLQINGTNTNPTYLFNAAMDYLPSSLKFLSISSDHFDSPLDNLPLQLKTLKVNSPSFNQSLDNLPPNLTHLTIDHDHQSILPKFNMPLDNLPQSLTHLDINFRFDFAPCEREYNGDLRYLPKSLHFLKLQGFTKTPLPFLPPNLIKLEFDGEFIEQDTSNWPKSLIVTAVDWTKVQICVVPI